MNVYTEPRVTVIVPIYRGIADVTRCLESVTRHAGSVEIPFEVLLIDDASPEAEVRAYVESFESSASGISVSVLRNDENLGFVATVNRGLRRAQGDAVILNSDAAVTAGWLDRLADAARMPDVATVTPLTNEGSLCTMPRSIIDAFDLETAHPRIDECAAFVAGQSLRLLPEVIAGVGFCMYITREALDLCGLFDEGTFGKGYGEEIDFCLRGTRVGLRHLVEDSTFVYHRGGGSFGAEQREGSGAGRRSSDDRYPFFRSANLRERADDPLRVAFAASNSVCATSTGSCARAAHAPQRSRTSSAAPRNSSVRS